MAKRQFCIIKFEVYPFDILISIHKNTNILKQELKKITPTGIHSQIDNSFDGNYIGRTLMFKNGSMCIHFRNTDTANISHEIFHSVCALMDYIGLKLTNESEEAYAYLIGYLTNKVYEFLDGR